MHGLPNAPVIVSANNKQCEVLAASYLHGIGYNYHLKDIGTLNVIYIMVYYG